MLDTIDAVWLQHVITYTAFPRLVCLCVHAGMSVRSFFNYITGCQLRPVVVNSVYRMRNEKTSIYNRDVLGSDDK